MGEISPKKYKKKTFLLPQHLITIPRADQMKRSAASPENKQWRKFLTIYFYGSLNIGSSNANELPEKIRLIAEKKVAKTS
jgi:hypothetical protein